MKVLFMTILKDGSTIENIHNFEPTTTCIYDKHSEVSLIRTETGREDFVVLVPKWNK